MHASPIDLETVVRSLVERWLKAVPTQGVVQPNFEPFALATHRGLVRKENQDRVVVAKLPSDRHGVATYIGILSDGMGGMEGGDLAANLATAGILAALATERQPDSDAALRQAMLKADAMVFELLRGRGGAAVCAFVRRGESLALVSAGDVRAYAVEHDRTLRQVTTDDTLAAQLAALGKTPSPDQGRLLQYVGMGQDLQPHVHRVTGDLRAILVTSDGAHSLPVSVLQFIVRSSDTPKTLVSRLLEVSTWPGGVDNASAIAFGLSHTPDDTLSMPSVIDLWTPSHVFSFCFELPAAISAETHTNESPVAVPTAQVDVQAKKDSRRSRKKRYEKHHVGEEQRRSGTDDSTRRRPSEPKASPLQLLVTFPDGDATGQGNGESSRVESEAPSELPHNSIDADASIKSDAQAKVEPEDNSTPIGSPNPEGFTLEGVRQVRSQGRGPRN